MQPECRCRRYINIGRAGIIKGSAEHLANLGGRNSAASRSIGPELAAWRRAGAAYVDNTANCPGTIDDQTATAGHRSRKAGDKGFARLNGQRSLGDNR